MAFGSMTRSKAATRPAKGEPIFGVGCNAFVNWPHPADAVPLVASGAQRVPNDLADGQEVEIISWRPRSREGLAYQIRRLSDGGEYWILAIHLRRQRDATRPMPAASTPPRVAPPQ